MIKSLGFDSVVDIEISTFLCSIKISGYILGHVKIELYKQERRTRNE